MLANLYMYTDYRVWTRPVIKQLVLVFDAKLIVKKDVFFEQSITIKHEKKSSTTSHAFVSTTK